jgi:type I restriction enzyme R subunit
MSNFNENIRVQVPAALHLYSLGYTYLDDIKDYKNSTNIITPIFLNAVKRLNSKMTELECTQLLDKIERIADNDDLGREFYNMLSANSGIKLIDFENPDNNDWHVTTEFTCANVDSGDEFRPDITCFVNGLPLAFIEVKKPNNSDGILAERERINRRMRNRKFRRFLNITQIMIFSNNQEYDNDNRVPIQGAFYCCTSKDKAFFNAFREEDKTFVQHYNYKVIPEDEENKVLRHRNCVVMKDSEIYETNKDVKTPTNRILTSMLSKERFLFLLRYGIAYVDQKIELEDGTKSTILQKQIMRYQQLFASLAIRKKLLTGIKSGIIWHTQGSGKTALAFYSVRSLTDFYAKQNIAAKFYFIVDRIALMEQAADEFVARGLVVRTATSRKELMDDFKDNKPIVNIEGKPEIMVVNIQKFKEDASKISIDGGYSTHLQRIFFVDEAHRGYNPQGSFLANLLEADKDSIKIALTGTPLLKEERESWRVFGDYINTYYYDKSIADGYTLKLMREPIETIYKETIENILDNLAGGVEVKKSDIDKNKILENDTYLNALLDYIISDFRKFRREQADDSVGAMIVCRTNPQAREMYRLWQKRFNQAKVIEEKREEKMLTASEPMSNFDYAKPLRASLILHDEGDKEERKEYIEEYKKLQTIDVLIVNQMLLTGFDSPRLKRLYLGRLMDGHDLLQALTRVNRPYKDFSYGYVVDFVDIKENFDATNDRYLRELNRTNDPDETGEVKPTGNVIIEDKDAILNQMKQIKSVLFNFTCENPEEFRKEIDEIENKDSLYELRTTLSDAKAIMNQVRSYGDEALKEKINKLSMGAIPTLITEVNHRIERINLIGNEEHKADVSGIINIALSELEFEFKKGISEELRIIVNDLQERCERVQSEFEANFDQNEEKYVILADEFREYFRKKGFVPQSTKEAKESIDYMDGVMKKIKEINRRNRILKKKYRGDERFVRIHKRIDEENQKRKKPIIGKEEYEIALGLSQMKREIDNTLFLNVNVLQNEDKFKRDVLALVGNELIQLNIKADLSDRRFINNLITNEYLQQYNYTTAQ